MKTLLITFCFCIASLFAHTQTITYLKVADKAEYAKYLEYCLTPVERTFYMRGKVSLLKVNGQYTDSIGTWVAKYPLTIKWYPIFTKVTTTEAYQHEIVASFKVMVPRRYPTSVDDFYKWWKTGFIQGGMLDAKCVPVWDYYR